MRLIDALAEALEQISRNPGTGSPTLDQELGIAGMRTWLVRDFPLAFWYFERDTHIDVARPVGQRQDALTIDVFEP